MIPLRLSQSSRSPKRCQPKTSDRRLFSLVSRKRSRCPIMSSLRFLSLQNCHCLAASRTHIPCFLLTRKHQPVTESLLSCSPLIRHPATSPLYEEAATSGCCLSSMLAFSRSAAASAAASFSWASSAPALASPLAPCFSAAGFRPFSVVPWAASDSASRRSISACALAMF